MDLRFLSSVYESGGPYASVCLEPRPVGGPETATEVELRWEGLCRRLAAAGADDATLTALAGRIVPDRPGGSAGHGRMLIGCGGRVVLDRELTSDGPDNGGGADPVTVATARQEPPAETEIRQLLRDSARWAPLPHVLPLLLATGRPLSHVVVVADRIGADIHLTTAAAGTTAAQLSTVDGADQPLHKVQAGGWSHRRFQQRAENRWERNAALVADAVSRLAVRHRAELVLLAGDVRARAAISERLPSAVRPLVVETEHGGRAPGAADGPLRAETRRILSAHARAVHSSTVDRFAVERDHRGRAVEGLGPVVSALRGGQVEALLLRPVAHPTHRLWTGDNPVDIAVTRTELERDGVEEYVRDRADSVLLRACAATAAAVELLRPTDPAITDGVGAILRFNPRA